MPTVASEVCTLPPGSPGEPQLHTERIFWQQSGAEGGPLIWDRHEGVCLLCTASLLTLAGLPLRRSPAPSCSGNLAVSSPPPSMSCAQSVLSFTAPEVAHRPFHPTGALSSQVMAVTHHPLSAPQGLTPLSLCPPLPWPLHSEFLLAHLSSRALSPRPQQSCDAT